MHAKYTLFFFLLAVYFDEGSPFNITNKLSKLKNECISPLDYLEMTGYVAAKLLAEEMIHDTMPSFIETIGLMELRKTLGFGPVRPWKHHTLKEKDLKLIEPWKDTVLEPFLTSGLLKLNKPSEEELADAKTLEDYYNLMEPISRERSLDSEGMPEKTFLKTLQFLDKKLPSIRAMFKNTFEEMGTMDTREKIDAAIKKFEELVKNTREAIEEGRKGYEYSCEFQNFATRFEYPEKARANQTLLLEIEEQAAAAPQPDPSTFNITHKLAKIGSTCFSKEDFNEMTENSIGPKFGAYVARDCLGPSLETIGLNELRRSLDFEPLGPWKKNNKTRPSIEEIEGAKTFREYYDFKEPKDFARSLGSSCCLFESNMPGCLKFVNNRFPSIRTMFRMKYKEIRGSDEVDKKVIDKLIGGFNEITDRIHKAPHGTMSRSNCWFSLML